METNVQTAPPAPTPPQPAPRPKSAAKPPARALVAVLILIVTFGALVGVAAGVGGALHKSCAGIPTKLVWKWESCPAATNPFPLPQVSLPQSLPSFGGATTPTDPPNRFPIPTSDPGPNGDNPKD